MKLIKRYWFRLNVILGYPLLLLCDCGIALTTDQYWINLRNQSDEFAVELWNRY